MKTYVPDYYPLFRCKGGSCGHNCCIGWEIGVDEETLAYYRRVPGAFGERIQKALIESEEGATFRLTEGDRCPFLNEENLCDIYTCLGEEHLCGICAEHPRFRSYVNGRREIGLGLCCEEAAALILRKIDPVRWLLWEDDGKEEEGTPWERELFAKREEILALLQNRQMPLTQRIQTLTADPWQGKSIAEWQEIYLSLERLEEGWSEYLSFLTEENARSGEGPDEIAGEQLLVYFVNRHLAEAWDREDLTVRLAFCVLSYGVIAAISAGMPDADVTEIARAYSAEIEYSEENTASLLETLEALLPETSEEKEP